MLCVLWFAVCEGFLPYSDMALFDPVEFGSRVWPAARSTEMASLGGDWYNPGIAILSSPLRHQLSQLHGRNVTYLMSFRRNLDIGSCKLLVNKRHRRKPRKNMTLDELSDYGAGIVSDRMSSHMLLVDDQMTPIWPPLTLTGALFWILNADDLRLETKERFGNKVLAHGNTRTSRETWYNNVYGFWWLDIKAETHEINVTYFEHANVHANPWRNRERIQNIGIIWNGDDHARFKLLWWLHDPIDVRVGVPPHSGPNLSAPRNELTNGLPDSQALHGNGSPISLDDYYPGLAIAMGHTHLDMFPHGREFYNHTRWHNTYLSNFVIFKIKPPHEVLATSPPFCFASVSPRSPPDNPRCDIIQFVVGFVRSARDQSRILITYGVNDCESAWIEIPIADIIQFTSPDLHTRRQPPPLI